MTIVVIIICLVIVAQIAGISVAFTYMITKPKKTAMEESQAWQKDKKLWQDFDTYPQKEWCIKGYGEYLLHGILLPNEGKRFVIITHGYTDTRYGSVKYAHIYHKLGYQVYLYDLRYHGENVGGHCSMGYYESRDLVAIAHEIWRVYGEDCEIGLHGESLGSASSILALGLEQRFAFLVSDCGFSDLKELMRYQAKARFHLPEFLAQTASWVNWILHRYAFFDIVPKAVLQTNQVPILFIHGLADNFIPTSMCQDMYDQTAAQKELYLVEEAAHASSYLHDPVMYEEKIETFLKDINRLRNEEKE